ncbi:MAG TPA: carboxypeptidase regulatory-like domain-containing protein [Patescibacteria group bacterium]|nr:carboxypeptidase regulatory-like domain-containing protein [Patescibacteria group bacterium]
MRTARRKKIGMVRALGAALFTLCFATVLIYHGRSSALAAGPAAWNAVLQGTVTNAEGRPMRGAVVTATMNNPAATVRQMSVSRYSDDAGRYRITGLEPGTYSLAATAWDHSQSEMEKAIAGTTEVNFTLKQQWSPFLISTSTFISAYGQQKGIRNIEATCTDCHNFSWIMRRYGSMNAEQWANFIPNMSPRHLFVTPQLSAQERHDIGIDLAKYFGPGVPLPTEKQVEHVAIGDAALRATFRYFTPPTVNIAHSLSAAPDGKVWFTEFDNYANRLASFDPETKRFHEYELPAPKVMPHNPWAARNGMVWVSEAAVNKLAMLNPKTGKFTEFQAPAGTRSHTIREDHAGNIWVSDLGFPPIKNSYRFNPRTKKFTVYEIAGYDIAVDSHNNAYSGDFVRGTIDRADAETGTVKRYPIPGGAKYIRGIEVDTHDNVWFGDVLGHRLGMLNPRTGKFKFYTAPTPNLSIYGIVVNRKTGLLWIADYLGASVDSFDPATGKWTIYPFPSRLQMIRFFALGSQGRIWFTDFTNGRIGYLQLGQRAMSAQKR